MGLETVMDSPDRTRTKPRALATVLLQILFYIYVLCIYILVMMAWVRHSYCVTCCSLELAC
ncbi:hypothetical protein BDW71DRAFT_176043 [Aspergillus fruticulosus]